MTLRLQGRLFILIFVSFIPLVLLSIYWTITVRNISYTSSQLSLQLITRVFTDRQSDLIGSGQAILSGLALNPVLLETNTSNIQKVLENTLKNQSCIANIALVDIQGQMIADAISTKVPINYSDREWFQEILETENFTLGEYIVEETKKIPIQPLAYPLLDTKASLAYVLTASIDLNWIYLLAAELSLPPGTTITITDLTGKLLVRYPNPEKFVGTDIHNSDIGKEMIKNKKSSLITKGLEGTTRLYDISPLLINDTIFGSIALSFPLDEIYQKADTSLKLNLSLLIVAFLIALMLLLWGLRTLVISPSREILKAFEFLAAGKSDFRLEQSHRKDEISLLLPAFNGMATELQSHRLNLESMIEMRTKDLEEKTKALEELTIDLKRSNEELGQFAYVASHDLQEPLRMVASFTQLLGERYKGKLDPQADEYIFFAVDGSRRMQALINDLLAYSRIGTRGKKGVITDTKEIVAEILKDLEIPIQESEAKVIVGILPSVFADKTQLSQVFQNLISNALKFHGDKKPVIEISAQKEDDCWNFSIKDNGIGIDSQYFERIFLVFQRLHERTAYPGNGIGLSIVKKIIERHGGRVWVESEVGNGSQFHFTLPLESVLGEEK